MAAGSAAVGEVHFMKTRAAHRLVNIFVAFSLLSWTTVAVANVGVGVFIVAAPAVLIALIPAVFVEALILVWMLKVSILRGLFLTTVANLISTILGVIVSFGLDRLLLAGSGSSGLVFEKATVIPILVPFFFFSWLIEHLVIARREANKPWRQILKATGIANFITYILMAIYVIFVPFVPEQGGYSTCATVIEGLSLASAGKTAVSEFIAIYGRLPANNEEAGMADAELIASHSVDNVRVANGVITVTFSRSPIAGSAIALTPQTAAGKFVWNCTGGNLENKYRPSSCRE